MTTNIYSYDGDGIKERETRLLLKALLVWVKVRFNAYSKNSQIINILQSIEQLKNVALISDKDAWVIEKNAVLFNIIAKTFTKEFLSDNIHQTNGNVLFLSSRKNNFVDMMYMPIAYNSIQFSDITPSSMFIMKQSDLIKQYKKDSYIFKDNSVDIIPLLKREISNILTISENKLIDQLFDKYKNDKTVLESKENIVKQKEQEENNLKNVLKVINTQSSSMGVVKLAITIFSIVKTAYKVNPHKIFKVKFQQNDTIAVMDFSFLFNIEYDIDLNIIKQILDPIIFDDIKIKVSHNKILFTTSNKIDIDQEEQDINEVNMLTIDSKETLDNFFDTHIGPTVSVNEVNKIMEKYLQQKYNAS